MKKAEHTLRGAINAEEVTISCDLHQNAGEGVILECFSRRVLECYGPYRHADAGVPAIGVNPQGLSPA